jgi:hypothetical protein
VRFEIADLTKETTIFKELNGPHDFIKLVAIGWHLGRIMTHHGKLSYEFHAV